MLHDPVIDLEISDLSWQAGVVKVGKNPLAQGLLITYDYAIVFSSRAP